MAVQELTYPADVHHLYDMKLSFLPTREISARPGAVMAQLHRDGMLIITDHGKPRALMLPMGEDTFMQDIADLISLKANQALRDFRARAAATGLDKMTDAEIDAEIAAVRRARKKQE